MVRFLVGFLFCVSLEASDRVASIASFAGKVAIKRETGEVVLVKRRRAPLFQGDRIATGSKSKAIILFSDGSRVDIGAKAIITIRKNGRKREIVVDRGTLRSDIKKLPGMKTSFRTPAGVAAVKGTMVDCVVTEDGVEISADLGLLTHNVDKVETSIDLSAGKRVKLKLDGGKLQSRSLSGDVEMKTKMVVTQLPEQSCIKTGIENETIVLSVVEGKVKSKTERGMCLDLDGDDEIVFVETGSGLSVSVVKGEVSVVDELGVRTMLRTGETMVSPFRCIEPETPEGHEVMIPEF